MIKQIPKITGAARYKKCKASSDFSMELRKEDLISIPPRYMLVHVFYQILVHVNSLYHSFPFSVVCGNLKSINTTASKRRFSLKFHNHPGIIEL